MDDMARIVHTHDIDRYLSALFVPGEKRAHVMALYAFNAEVNRIAYNVSEPQLAEIRLQFWMDVVDSIFHGDVQAHPVAQALAGAVQAGDIPKYALMNLLKAHQFDFYSDPMPSLNDLEGYLGETQSSVIKMAAMIMDSDGALEASEACGLAGVRYGVAQVLNQLPRAQRLKQCFLPADLLAKRQVDPTHLFDPESEAGIGVVLADLRALAEERREQLRRVTWTISPKVAPAFLHVALADPYLQKARKRGRAVLVKGCDISPLRKQWLIYKAAKQVRF
ncbi:phytoene/squalene synthase family protein [Aestuariivirga litoralis]|uniref:phytoene/squalene synthase family protein n=1 Tax=Aestuariivirga litoralis TaxID=2650924 RepID=UPI0018C6713C|nr:squalene/phytoene synthase family protein [Aestuariivirga litoralis]MBG1231476.1 phytoene/squalene synthase family protein [Aestuariivirga litoralis]